MQNRVDILSVTGMSAAKLSVSEKCGLSAINMDYHVLNSALPTCASGCNLTFASD